MRDPNKYEGRDAPCACYACESDAMARRRTKAVVRTDFKRPVPLHRRITLSHVAWTLVFGATFTMFAMGV